MTPEKFNKIRATYELMGIYEGYLSHEERNFLCNQREIEDGKRFGKLAPVGIGKIAEIADKYKSCNNAEEEFILRIQQTIISFMRNRLSELEEEFKTL